MEERQGDQKERDLQTRLGSEFQRDPHATVEGFLRGAKERHDRFQRICDGFQGMPKPIRDLRFETLVHSVATINLDELEREITETIQTEEDKLRDQHPDWQRIPVEAQSVP
ncbi:MAG: hypothetical protein WC242_00190 [Candidatus Paceibacterota bacterium]|jgi:protein gp37